LLLGSSSDDHDEEDSSSSDPGLHISPDEGSEGVSSLTSMMWELSLLALLLLYLVLSDEGSLGLEIKK
jgi:hypothetical protein